MATPPSDLRANVEHRPTRAPDRPFVPTPVPAEVPLRCVRGGTLVLRGPRTGRVYLFSDRRGTAVSPADVEPLLRTGVLERVAG